MIQHSRYFMVGIQAKLDDVLANYENEKLGHSITSIEGGVQLNSVSEYAEDQSM